MNKEINNFISKLENDFASSIVRAIKEKLEKSIMTLQDIEKFFGPNKRLGENFDTARPIAELILELKKKQRKINSVSDAKFIIDFRTNLLAVNSTSCTDFYEKIGDDGTILDD